MTIGTSIFLSVVLLSAILLFISTKDRWKWKKILFFFIGIPLVLCVLIGGVYWTYLTISNRPHFENTFWNIPITASKSEVKFLKGEPSKKYDDESWLYNFNDFTYLVGFKNDKIHYIEYFGKHDYESPLIQGIRKGDNSNGVMEKFGSTPHVSISKDELSRIWSFEKYGVFFVFEKDSVAHYGIYNTALGPIEYAEGKSIR